MYCTFSDLAMENHYSHDKKYIRERESKASFNTRDRVRFQQKIKVEKLVVSLTFLTSTPKI